MADHFPFKLERKATIAVMGLPYTFRKKMGEYISNWEKCPSLTFEVILNELPNFDEIEGAALDISVDRSDVAFSILCKTPLSLLNRHQPNCVVINFPMLTKHQLEKLISLHVASKRRLLIIECQRRSHFRWRQAVEHPSRGIWYSSRYNTRNWRPGKWEDVEKAIQKHQQQQQGLDACFLTSHNNNDYVKKAIQKPGKWEDVEKAIQKHQQQQQGLDACFLTTRNNNDYVKKLVVDPFQDLRARDFTDEEGLDTRSLFAQAIKDYLTCGDYKYFKLTANLDYSVWRRKWLKQQAKGANSSMRGTSASGLWLCEPGDCILRFTNNLKRDPICEACQEKIKDGEGAYYCQLCSLSLHQPCAVAQYASTANTITISSRLKRSEVLHHYSNAQASKLFPTEDERSHINDACYPCKREGKPFSGRREGCNGCVYKAHLKAQLLPTAFNHSFDKDHFLSIRLSWHDAEGSIYNCKACGLRGKYSSYSCNICNSEYHLECVLQMPLQTDVGNPKHGGHAHSMEMQFRCGEKEYEYEWCPVCYKDIDPDTWVYTCKHSDCDFVAHLYCIFPSYTFKQYKELTGKFHMLRTDKLYKTLTRNKEGHNRDAFYALTVSQKHVPHALTVLLARNRKGGPAFNCYQSRV